MDDMARLGFSVDSSPLRSGRTDLRDFGQEAGRTGDSLAGMGEASRRGFGVVTAAVTGAVAALASLGTAIRTISEFESSMSRLGAVSGATSDQLEAMRDIARDLGATTEFSAKQAADGLNFLAMAGFSATESMAAIPSVLDLATASGLGLAQAADTASNIMSGFGIAAENAAGVSDVLAAASSRANTDVSQLGAAMSTVAPIAAALDISLADTAASIGVLSDAGIQGERAGTALRGVMASLAGPTDAATDVFEKLGLTIGDIDPAANDLSDVMQRLGDAGLSTADAMTVFGREAASGALVLIDGARRLGEFGDELKDVDGAARDMADTMRDNLGGDIKGLQSAVSGLILALGDAGLTSVLRAVVGAITAVTRGITAIVNAFSDAASAVGGFVSGLVTFETANDRLTQGMQLAEQAIDNSTIAMGDQIRQSALLEARMSDGNVMTLESARVNLESAKARLEDVAAMRTQNELAARQSLGVDEIFADVARAQAALSQARNNLTSEDIAYMDEYGDRYQSATASLFRDLEDALVNQLQAQQAANDALAEMEFLSPEQEEQQALVLLNIERLEQGIASATDGMVSFGGSVVSGTALSDRLREAIGGIPKELTEAASEMASVEHALGSAMSGYREDVELTSKVIDLMADGLSAAQIQAVQLAGIDIKSAPADAVVEAVRLSGELGVSIENGFGIANAISSINFGSAVSGAQALSAQLGVSLQQAMQMMGLLGAAAQAAGDSVVFDPRDPRFDAAAAASASQLSGIQSIMDGFEYNGTEVTSLGSVGGSGGASGQSSIDQTTAALHRQIEALEDAADPTREYTRGLAELDELKLLGLSDGAYALAVQELADEFGEAEVATSEFTETFQDGMKDALEYTINGWRDGFSGLLDIFKDTLTSMIKAAAENPIKVALGIGGTAGVAGGQGLLGGAVQSALGGVGGTGGLLGAFTGGSGLAAGFSGLAGGTGILGGLGNTLAGTFGTGGGIGGLFSSIGGGAGILSSIGAALPIIGIAGAVFSFFKKKTKILDEGIRATIDMEDAMFESFQKIQTSRFWGLSKKTSYSYSDLSDEEASPFIEAVSGVRSDVVEAAESLGLSADIFDGFSHSFRISLKGLDDAAKEAAVLDALQGLGDAMAEQIEGLDELQDTGEGAYDALTRLSLSLATVNDAFSDLGFGLYDVSLAGAAGAAAFADLFGTLDGFSDATASYYDLFYSDQEKITNATARLSENLADLGIDVLPTTNAAFRELVETAMLAGDSDLAASLIQLAPAFDTVTDATDALAASLSDLSEDAFTTGVDYKRALSRANNGIVYEAGDRDAALLAELQALNARVDLLQSTSEITAANTGKAADNTEDQVIIALEAAT